MLEFISLVKKFMHTCSYSQIKMISSVEFTKQITLVSLNPMKLIISLLDTSNSKISCLYRSCVILFSFLLYIPISLFQWTIDFYFFSLFSFFFLAGLHLIFLFQAQQAQKLVYFGPPFFSFFVRLSCNGHWLKLYITCAGKSLKENTSFFFEW